MINKFYCFTAILDAATSGSDDEDNEFYDAQEEGGSVAEDSSLIFKIPMSSSQQRRNSTDAATGSSSEGEEGSSEKTQQVLVVTDNPDLQHLNANMDQIDRVSVHSNNSMTPILPLNKSGAVVKRRLKINDKPNYPLNLWSIIKNCIGKDLSKIPMPVNFNEPLSLLQR